MKKVLGLLLLFNFAFAFPPLQPYQQGSVQMNVPVSWNVQIDEQQGLINLQENPNDPNSPQIFMIVQANTNNVSPTALIQEAVNGLTNSGLSNVSLLDNQSLEAGSMTTISGNMQNKAVKVALVSFTSGNYITLAVFNAPSQRFDELGGANLIFVTVGGQDPAQYSNTQNSAPLQNSANLSAECIDPNNFLYDAEYCVYERYLASDARQPVDISYFQGKWDFAISIPSYGGSAWENIATGDISYDGSGKGMSIIFHKDGSYDIIYIKDISSGACYSAVKAYEHGNYQYDGLKVNLSKTSFEGTISTCGGQPTAMTETGQSIRPESMDVVFINQNELFMQFNCENRGYIIGCNDSGEYLFKLTRSQ